VLLKHDSSVLLQDEALRNGYQLRGNVEVSVSICDA
jgi:hypothetical protein